jgi:hypothetical protein
VWVDLVRVDLVRVRGDLVRVMVRGDLVRVRVRACTLDEVITYPEENFDPQCPLQLQYISYTY